MADALCGPSNALQNFQKQTAVDRTLQQDRLVNRQTGAQVCAKKLYKRKAYDSDIYQGFRSSSSANAGVLDPEFEAFQAGIAPQPDFLQHHHHVPPPHIAQHFQQSQQPGPQVAGWAADFQRMSISSPAANVQQQPFRQPAATASWHQDFLQQGQQQQRTFSPPQAQAYGPSMVGGMGGYGMGGYAGTSFQQTPFMNAPNTQLSSISQGNQFAQAPAPQLSDAAFEQAFQQAQADMLESSQPQAQETQQPTTYLSILTRIERMEYNVDPIETPSQLKNLHAFKETITQNLTGQEREKCLSRVDMMIQVANQRMMSTYPLFGSENAEPMETPPQLQPLAEQQTTKQEQPLPPKTQDDEMAETAGHLLEKVANNTSEKFQKSQFLELMRRLRDREVRVEGDKVVEVSIYLLHTTV